MICSSTAAQPSKHLLTHVEIQRCTKGQQRSKEQEATSMTTHLWNGRTWGKICSVACTDLLQTRDNPIIKTTRMAVCTQKLFDTLWKVGWSQSAFSGGRLQMLQTAGWVWNHIVKRLVAECCRILLYVAVAWGWWLRLVAFISVCSVTSLTSVTGFFQLATERHCAVSICLGALKLCQAQAFSFVRVFHICTILGITSYYVIL